MILLLVCFLSFSTTLRRPVFGARGLSTWEQCGTDPFFQQVIDTVDKVFDALPPSRNILNVPEHQRESLGVAKIVSRRLSAMQRNKDCPRCWLQAAHCICSQTTSSIEDSLPHFVHRVFLILNHKEIGMVVDTAKLLLMSMPNQARLVVSGIAEDYQESLVELKDALQQKERPCIVLFPTEDAQTFEDLYQSTISSKRDDASATDTKLDVVVIDGTWQQAQKIHQRYIPAVQDGGPCRVCLSDAALELLGGGGGGGGGGDQAPTSSPSSSIDSHSQTRVGSGKQLRRHPIAWKEISTLEATRLLFRDMMQVQMSESSSSSSGNHADSRPPKNDDECYNLLREFQALSDAAARAQLGPPRRKTNESK